MLRLRQHRILTALRRNGVEVKRRSTEAGAMALGFVFPWKRLAIGVVAMLVIGVIAASQGSVWIPPLTVVKILASKLPIVEVTQTWPDSWETILWRLRLPRVALAGLVGISLSLSGATYQGLFRNPLADPYLIGVASGAGLGATIVLLTGVPSYFGGFSLLPVVAFFGGVASITLAYMIARQSDGLPLTTLILAGVAITSLTGAIMSLLMIRSDPDIRPVFSWLLGGFISAQWQHSLIILTYLVPGLLLTLSYGRILNVLQLDEEQARQLGVNTERAKLVLIATATLMTAAAVSFSGLIGFVGLVAPHAVRLMWGGDYRMLLPMAAIVGAAFLILADLAARMVASPTELPVGIITAISGVPFFLFLLRRRKRVTM